MNAPTPQPPDTLHGAHTWYDADCSVVRVATDGSKKPDGTWKQYMARRADRDTLTRWFATGHPGLGVVCGAISGHLELLEAEGRAVDEGLLPRLIDACERLGISDVWATITTGCAEASPSGGLHLLYRVPEGVAGNAKLAQRLARPDEYTPEETVLAAQGKQIVRALFETRGEGGFVVVAPSHGPTHRTGRPYQFLAGGPHTIPTITGVQRDLLHIAAHSLDQMPPAPAIPDTTPRGPHHPPEGAPGGEDGLAPGADYNQRGDWTELLTGQGWTRVWGDRQRTYWRRPGKTFGISAVTGGAGGDYMYVWSTSTVLPAETGISRWRVYAMLHHGGDYPAAAKALAAAGYGTRPAPTPPARPVFTVLPGGLAAAVAPAPAPVGVTTRERTDDALALALVASYGGVIRYCPDRGRWLSWVDPAWTWCPAGGGAIREHVKVLARALPEDDAGALRFRAYALSASGTTGILTQAATDPRVIVTLHELDARPYELNTPGGTVDLRSGVLTPADPTHLHTRVTVHAPDTEADPGAWHQFLDTTFAGRADVIEYAHRLAGYSITGVVTDHILPFCYGARGHNGKTVFLETIQKILGDYAISSPAGFLMVKQFASHETEIAQLAGTRFVVCSEINEDDKFDEARVKLLTGGDTIAARFMRQDHFTFSPSHHLWLMGNHQPTVSAGGPAFWRRLRIVPFDHQVSDEDRDSGLTDRLVGQHGGAVMAWLVSGAVAYTGGGLTEPVDVVAATDHYAHEQDSVMKFVEDECRVGGGDSVRVRTAVLRTAYERWCTAEGVAPVSARRLTTTLRGVSGVDSVRSNGVRLYSGISLIAGAAGDGGSTRPGEQ